MRPDADRRPAPPIPGEERRGRPRVPAALLAVLAGLALAVSPARPGFAHAALVATDPEEGATLATAPAQVTATFSEVLDAASTEIAVTGPGGALVDAGAPAFDADTFTQPMRYLGPGDYTVAFRVISEDGHRVDGALTFTVEQVPPDLLDSAAETAAATAAETDAAAATDAEAAEDPASGASATAVALALLLVLAAAVATAVLLRRRGARD